MADIAGWRSQEKKREPPGEKWVPRPQPAPGSPVGWAWPGLLPSSIHQKIVPSSRDSSVGRCQTEDLKVPGSIPGLGSVILPWHIWSCPSRHTLASQPVFYSRKSGLPWKSAVQPGKLQAYGPPLTQFPIPTIKSAFFPRGVGGRPAHSRAAHGRAMG